MFADASLQYTHFNQSSESFSSCSSDTSFQSNISDASWASATSTPISSPNRYVSRGSPVKLEEGFQPTNLSFDSMTGFCNIPTMTQDIMTNFSSVPATFSADEKMLVDQSSMQYGFEDYFSPTSASFNSSRGVPGLDMTLDTPTSCSSSVPEDFVDPSQTTFMDDTFEDFQSPLRCNRMDFTLQYNTLTPDFDAAYALGITSQSIKPCSPYDDCKPMLATPSRCSPPRQPVFEPLPSSAALHRIQSTPSPRRDTSISRREPKDKKRNSQARGHELPLNIRMEPRASFLCTWDGCRKSFQRAEHLKRHERTHVNKDWHYCEFCETKFNRTDNLKAHVKLHCKQETKSSRTKYHPGAKAVLDQMNKRTKRSDKSQSACIKDEDSLGDFQTQPKRAHITGY